MVSEAQEIKLNVMLPPRLTFIDYPDDKSTALTLFIMGCDNRCEGCQNPAFADVKFHEDTTIIDIETLTNLIKMIADNNHANKIALVGGDPLYKENIKATQLLVHTLKEQGIDTCIYTGKEIEYVKENNITNFEYVKCGKYDKNKRAIPQKTDEFMQFASTNQKVYDANFNLISQEGKIIWKK